MQGESLVPLIAAARGGASGEQLISAAKDLGWSDPAAVTEKAKTRTSAAPPPLDTADVGIAHDGWKLVHHIARPEGAPEFELFDHAGDPLDLHDVAAEHADIVERLKGELGVWANMVEQNKLPAAEAAENVSSKELDRLKSLGYIQ